MLNELTAKIPAPFDNTADDCPNTNRAPAVRIGSEQWAVINVRIAIPGLGKLQDGTLERRIYASESTLRGGKIPAAEEVQSRLGVAFFGGKLLIGAVGRHVRVLIRRIK